MAFKTKKETLIPTSVRFSNEQIKRTNNILNKMRVKDKDPTLTAADAQRYIYDQGLDMVETELNHDV